MIFFSTLGVLAVSYTLHFRRRALSMPPENLRAALSRATTGEEQASEVDLRRGVLELDTRLRSASYIVYALLGIILAACIAMTAASVLPALALALSGLCAFLVSIILSIMLLREIPRGIGRQLDGD